MFLWWRLFYATLGSRLFVAGLRFLVSVADSVKPGATLAILETRIGASWPRRVPGWDNIHMSALLWQLRRRSIQGPDRRHPRRSIQRMYPLRIGCFGSFSGLLGFPPSLFAAFPASAKLFIYDLQHNGQLAPVLAGLAARYYPSNLEASADYPKAVRDVADAINTDDLDLLLVIREKIEAHDVLDQIKTPCIAYVCTGSSLLHHPSIDFHLYCQPEADFFPVANRLFCGVTRRPVPGHVVSPASLCFDPRDLDLTVSPASWKERLPLVVFHGSLYKLASRAFLDCLFSMMAELSDVDFVFMGQDSGGALRCVEESARRWGIEQRVHYEGSFSSKRDGEGRITDRGWHRVCTLLGEARLAPDPWPVGGASARFEAYALGAPTVHMGLRIDKRSWGEPQPALLEIPNLLIQAGTAWSVDEYRKLMVRCLRDEVFADGLARNQHKRSLSSCVPSEYWRMILKTFDDWSQAYGG